MKLFKTKKHKNSGDRFWSAIVSELTENVRPIVR